MVKNSTKNTDVTGFSLTWFMITGCFSRMRHTAINIPFYLTIEKEKKKENIFAFILTIIDAFYTATSVGAD